MLWIAQDKHSYTDAFRARKQLTHDEDKMLRGSADRRGDSGCFGRCATHASTSEAHNARVRQEDSVADLRYL